jgi:hypothetical protein
MRFSAALDEICANIVGMTMFKVLMTKMIVCNILKSKGPIRILQYAGDGSRYSPQSRDFAVKINSNFYELDGTGISSRRYYGITKNGKVRTKLKSMAGSMFHEFCHALHHISGPKIDHEVYCVSAELQEVWGKDEELRTICCLNLNGLCHDPICDHCFDLVQSIAKGKRFLPRCSHNIGYRSGRAVEDAENREKLLQHFLKYKILLEGYLEYAI